jgi:nitrite reductase (NO-forming)
LFKEFRPAEESHPASAAESGLPALDNNWPVLDKKWLATISSTNQSQPMKCKFSCRVATRIGLIARLLCTAGVFAGVSQAGAASDPAIGGEENAVLTQAPNVPPPIKRTHPTKVVVTLEVKEVVRRLADGVDYLFWTFGGDVPGSFIRVREGDLVEFHLNNSPHNKMPHNIDLHAVTGPGGGAASSFTAPGHSSQFSFKVLNPGLYVYHCATAPVPMHVGNGMYGLILVEPKEGLAPVEREYYVMQSEVYTTGKFGEEGLQAFSMDKALDERPAYVVFNGAVNSLVGDQALTAKVGETIRLFVGNGGPNLTSSFHVIGEIFDTVYPEGGTKFAQNNVQTTLVPSGGSAIVEFKVEVPGTFILVDHALLRAFNKGALGMLKVDGPENQFVYSGKEVDAVYLGQQAAAGSESARRIGLLQTELAAQIKTNPQIASLTKEIQIERGKQIYMQTCFVCHQPDGQGLAGQIPPLAKSDLLLSDKAGAIRGILQGRSGEITVNGKKYNGTMVPLNYLTNEQIANAMTYVLNDWGNTGDAVSAEEVRRVRSEAPPPPPNPYE